MPDPILPQFYRAMWIWKGVSGLPEDRYVNNWCFYNEVGAAFTTMGDEINTVLTAFYAGAGPSGQKITDWIPAAQIAGAELRVYDLGETPPRTPQIITPTLPALGTGPSLPEEVAVVMSIYTDDRSKRGRGRIYLGPLTQSVVSLDQGRPSLASSQRAHIADRADDVIGTTMNVEWHLLSGMDAAAKRVTGGYIDDAFDTVRSRGRAPTVRQPFGNYVLAA